MYSSTSVSFFMGANTPVGFYSLFDGLYDPEKGWKAYIIKGGPGTGKSTLMKKIAAEADRRGTFCERIYCSSDPRSLDAVILPGLKISAADGTPPHTIEPLYPGVCEKLVDLGSCRDDGMLSENAEEIIRKTRLNSAEHKKCVRFLEAAKSVNDDANRLVFSALRTDKLRRFARKLAENTFGTVSDSPGEEKKRFLSALTPEGEVVFGESFRALCEKCTVLEDNFGTASAMLLRLLKNAALESGYDCICCYCPMDPSKPEHLIIPALSEGFYTSNAFHPYGGTPDKVIDCARFCETEALGRHKNRLVFDRRARDELLAEAANRLRGAKLLHDELERFYIPAMDHGKLGGISEKITEEIFGAEHEKRKIP